MLKNSLLFLQKIFLLLCLSQGIHISPATGRTVYKPNRRSQTISRISKKKRKAIKRVKKKGKVSKSYGYLIFLVGVTVLVVSIPLIRYIVVALYAGMQGALLENTFKNFVYGSSAETEWESKIRKFSAEELQVLSSRGSSINYDQEIKKSKMNTSLMRANIKAKPENLSKVPNAISKERSAVIAQKLKELIQDQEEAEELRIKKLGETTKEIRVISTIMTSENGWSKEKAVEILKKFGGKITNKLKEQSNYEAIKKINRIIDLSLELKDQLDTIYKAMVLAEAMKQELNKAHSSLSTSQKEEGIRQLKELNKELNRDNRDIEAISNHTNAITSSLAIFADLDNLAKRKEIAKQVISKKMQLPEWIKCYSTITLMIPLVEQCFGTTEEFITECYGILKLALAKPITFPGSVYKAVQARKELWLNNTVLNLIAMQNIEEEEGDNKIKIKVNQNVVPPGYAQTDASATDSLKKGIIEKIKSTKPNKPRESWSDTEIDQALERLKDTTGSYYLLPKSWRKDMINALVAGYNRSRWASHIRNGMKKALAQGKIGFESANSITDGPENGLIRMNGGKGLVSIYRPPSWLYDKFDKLFYEKCSAELLLKEIKHRLESFEPYRRQYENFCITKGLPRPQDPHNHPLWAVKEVKKKNGTTDYTFECYPEPLLVTLRLIQAVD